MSDLSRRAFMGVGAGALLARSAGAAPIQPETEAAPEIGGATISEAQKLAGLEFDESECDMVARSAQRRVEAYEARRAFPLSNATAPATVFDARPFAGALPPAREISRFLGDPGPLPKADADIAFAPVSSLSRWLAMGQISSERLTRIYIERLKRYGPKLKCIVTLTEDLALQQARRADEDLRAGRYRGPLHGVPYGAKDLFDTAGIPTTWGATPYKERIPDKDAYVIRRLQEAGAVLVAKTTLGALAYGDRWFGGRTRNPWNIEQGSSGSSAGSAAATAAGLVGFSLGTETLGSIVSPSMRCGVTGLRPTFGRVARTGAMALCWSLDKIGPICRSVEDTMLVLDAINGADPGDPSSVNVPLIYDGRDSVNQLRVGYDPAWFDGRGATEIDKAALEALKLTGARLVETRLPELPPTGPLRTILNVEAAAAFEELTLSGRDDELVWQEPQAWPNTFRSTWFVPAIELMQAERIRRLVCERMMSAFEGVDALFGPSYAGNMLLVTNSTGHPSLTLRAGFRANNRPHGVTLWGRLFDEGTIGRLGVALEGELAVWDRRPDLG